MINKVFGKWTVISGAQEKNKNRYYTCRCECGNTSDIFYYNLLQGKSTKCRTCRLETGMVYGDWTVINESKTPRKNENDTGKYYTCKCKCNNIYDVSRRSLIRGTSTQCKECAVKKHGMDGTIIYRTWDGAKRRCTNPTNKDYKNYGGRGIKMCDRWVNSFENFYKDMGDKPSGFQLDRINNDGDYSPENCKWSTPKENSNNRRNSKKNNPTKSIF
ncbi:hypothetical protein [Methylobacter sp.]|uniref:hypothetical protein n=1 Tax=Methylobacter sp. TaxID=2051955 RepID=UPI003DA2C9A5